MEQLYDGALGVIGVLVGVVSVLVVIRIKRARKWFNEWRLRGFNEDYDGVLSSITGYERLRRLCDPTGRAERVLVGPNGVFMIMCFDHRWPGKMAFKNKIDKCNREAACVAEKIFNRLGWRPKVQPILCFMKGIVVIGEEVRRVRVVDVTRLSGVVRSMQTGVHFSASCIEAVFNALINQPERHINKNIKELPSHSSGSDFLPIA